MSDKEILDFLGDQKHGTLLDNVYDTAMNTIRELKADHVSKSELRAWCENEINNMATNYRLGWDGAMMAVIEKILQGEK